MSRRALHASSIPRAARAASRRMRAGERRHCATRSSHFALPVSLARRRAGPACMLPHAIRGNRDRCAGLPHARCGPAPRSELVRRAGHPVVIAARLHDRAVAITPEQAREAAGRTHRPVPRHVPVPRERQRRAVDPAARRIRPEPARQRLRVGHAVERLHVASRAGVHAARRDERMPSGLEQGHREIDVAGQAARRMRDRRVDRDTQFAAIQQLHAGAQADEHRSRNPAHTLQVVRARQAEAVFVGTARVVAHRRRHERAVRQVQAIAGAGAGVDEEAIAEHRGKRRSDDRAILVTPLVARCEAATERYRVLVFGVSHGGKRETGKRHAIAQGAEGWAHDIWTRVKELEV
ncbi:hypothetical protein BDI4_1350003 [Burkholderia diffusa]|nr:hypothetical protein BDI4_1350003 [Burkholderia diffusa]